MPSDVVILTPNPVADSIARRLEQRFPNSHLVVLYNNKTVDVSKDIPDLENTIWDTVNRLSDDCQYYLLVNGFCYSAMVAKDALYDSGLAYKLLIYDSFAGVHNIVEDRLLRKDGK